MVNKNQINREYAQKPELLLNAQWFVNIRWMVFALSLIGIVLAQQFINAQLPFTKLYFLSALILLSNACYFLIIKIKTRIRKRFHNTHLRLFLNLQVIFDLLILTLIIHFSGGIENPIIVFYIFHVILSSILLPRTDSFIQATLALFMFAGSTYLEHAQLIPHYTLNDHLSNLINSDKHYLMAALGIFTITIYTVVYLTSYVTKQLREHEMELELLNEELNEKDRIKNEYVLRLTHDVKGYVSSIKSNTEVLNRKVFGEIDKKYTPFITATNEVIGNLSLFIQDLLKLTKSKLEGQLEKTEIDLKSLVGDLVLSVADKAKQKNISVQHNIEIGLYSISAFEISIKEMLTNLVENAIKYSPENSEVRLFVKKQGSSNVLFEIIDQGIGIPEEEQHKIFSEFYRASNAKKNFEGTGLGLSIVKQIAKNHGGDAWFESKKGKGCQFYISIPL